MEYHWKNVSCGIFLGEHLLNLINVFETFRVQHCLILIILNYFEKKICVTLGNLLKKTFFFLRKNKHPPIIAIP